ncbi:MAG: DUF4174 domain-containing protein [Bacteroidetes bacterium]|nr:DUF4174 domain-containing protein [Bacteroidota bacterium]
MLLLAPDMRYLQSIFKLIFAAPKFVRMKYFSTIIFLLFFSAVSVHAQGVRRLLLFAGDSTNSDLKIQREWLQADSAGVVQRDIWIAIFADARTFRRMYDHHDVDRDEFTLVLMRKDGTQQFRSEKPVPLKDLFEIIDSPPAQAVEIGNNKPRNNQN